MKHILKKGITLAEFYENLPKLHMKYQNDIEMLNSTFCDTVTIDSEVYLTKYVLVIASRECIDSIVNLNALLCIQNIPDVEIKVLLKEIGLPEQFINDATPTIYGFDKNLNELWKWVRVPESIRLIENSMNQTKIIIEKKKYRKGLYLQDTLNELIKKMENHGNCI